MNRRLMFSDSFGTMVHGDNAQQRDDRLRATLAESRLSIGHKCLFLRQLEPYLTSIPKKPRMVRHSGRRIIWVSEDIMRVTSKPKNNPVELDLKKTPVINVTLISN